ncbi:hypothetical protein [Streptomyces formicae]|uniref:Uncharacterized protein n=1 Tax=Streptomyces formicae TaxID=1616117 RepID=A0ABY3WNE6_9ACTN|nr:hypothetical protein [Streptomyces formicae]UNM12312.1 hypothetical protein J4032_12905 [Streptomyces formicae]
MKASEAIHDRIHGPGHCDPPCGLCLEVVDLLEGYAHELAERIRQAEATQWPGSLADLIDPEVSSNER